MRLLTTRASLILVAVVVAAGCGKADWRRHPLSVETIAPPAAGNAASPQMTASGRGLLLSWIERLGTSTALKFTERSPTGWTQPLTAASGPLVTNYADVPSVVRLSNGTLAAHWTKETDRDREGTDLFISLSNDDGRSWTSPMKPHHDGTLTQHAFATLFELPAAGLGVIWLDARAYDLDQSDAIGLRYAAFDAGGKQTADAPIDDLVCECCPTAAAITADGPLAVYRDRSKGEVRDIYTSRLDNGTWTRGEAVHNDGWTIDACPVNGPAVSARGRDVVVGWFTTKDNQGQSYVAFSSDAGRTWGAPIRLDESGSLGRVAVDLLDDGTAVASWVEVTDKRGQLKVRRVNRAGEMSPAATVADVSTSVTSGYPRMKVDKDNAVFAWTERAGSGDDEEGAQLRAAVAHLSR